MFISFSFRKYFIGTSLQHHGLCHPWRDCSFFVDENKALVKGENAVESNHVAAVTQDPESGTLQGDIQASQRDKTYAVKVSFSVSCFTGP